MKQSLILELENGKVESWKRLLYFMDKKVHMRGIVAWLFQWYEMRGGTFSYDELEHLHRSLMEPRMQQSEGAVESHLTVVDRIISHAITERTAYVYYFYAIFDFNFIDY